VSSQDESPRGTNPLGIAFISSEVTPYAKTGGLADVSASLPRFLVESGHQVRQFMPLYGSIDFHGQDPQPVESLQGVQVELGDRNVSFSVFRIDLCEAGGDLYFVDCPEFFHRDELYGSASDEHLRFALLCRAVIESCQRLQCKPDIFHCNDWHTGLVPLYLRCLYSWDQLFANSKTVLTIHNIAYQGVFGRDVIPSIGLEGHERMFHREDAGNSVVNYLKTGVLYADAVTTVSETYAREIQTPEFGNGMEAVLKERKGTVVGIVNGVDY
jgi:starch synthase